ncbi:MAG: hypothetical protein MH472_02355 [Bacteroidia bacterium]|nr:hypothetical protein [Bacteroidia bacterium]
MKNKYLLLLSFILVGSSRGIGQEFKRVYQVEKIAKSAWYSCVLREDLRGYCASDFSDIRLYKAKDTAQEIPFLLREEELTLTEKNTDSLALKSIRYSIHNKNTKTTLIKVFSAQPQWIQVLSIHIDSARYFKREWRAYEKSLVRTKPRKKVWQETPIVHNEISSYGKTIFPLYHYLRDTIFIEIYNLDNPPLPIIDIKFFQKKLKLFAYLEKDEEYLIKCGNSALSQPRYDLSSFAKMIQDSAVNSLEYNDITTAYLKPKAKQNIRFYEQKYFVWLCIILGVSTLFFFSLKMLQEKKNEE